MMRLFKREEISWAALLVELFSVTLSVLVALAISEWSDRRSEQRAVVLSLQSIESEMASNQQVLEQKLAYYRRIRDALDRKIKERGTAAPAFPLPEWNGLQPPLLTTASYQAAIATQAFSHMEFRDADLVAKIYALQDLYNRFFDKMMDTFLAGRFETAQELRDVFQEIASFTDEVIKEQEGARARLRARAAALQK